MFFKSCAPERGILEHSFLVANVMSGPSWDRWFSLAATAWKMVVSWCSNSGVDAAVVVLDPGLSGIFESQSSDPPLARGAGLLLSKNPQDLHRELVDQPLSVFPGVLDSDVITMDRSADSPFLRSISTCSLIPCASQPPPRSLQARIPSLEQRQGVPYKLFLSNPHC